LTLARWNSAVDRRHRGASTGWQLADAAVCCSAICVGAAADWLPPPPTSRRAVLPLPTSPCQPHGVLRQVEPDFIDVAPVRAKGRICARRSSLSGSGVAIPGAAQRGVVGRQAE
jgi:hypothetical protein